MVTKLQKEETITELKDKFSRAKSVFATTQIGLTVAEITELRKQVRPLKAEYKIAKNTLYKKAAEGTDYAELTTDLKGPSAFIFCYDDPITPLSEVRKFSKAAKDKISIESGFLDGEFLNKDKAEKIASLPSKDTLLSQIAGMLVQNTQSIAYILDQLGQKPDQAKLLKDFIVADSPVEASSSGESTAQVVEEKKADSE